MGRIAPPERGCYVGVFASEWIPHSRFSESAVLEFERTAGKRAAVLEEYVPWDAPFPEKTCEIVRRRGSLPLITWEPWRWSLGKDSSGIDLQQIIDGKFDKLIRRWAEEARRWGGSFFIRWAHEFNGYWYPWSGYNNGDGRTDGYGDPSLPDGPERYVDAYRRVHGIFTDAGVEGATWVWCPFISSFPDEPWNQPESYYPGDEYVDWIGVDVFNWGGSEWFEFRQKFAPFYDRFSRGKPIFICDLAAAESPRKGRWISEAIHSLKSDFPLVKAFCWFNVRKERDWRLWSDTGDPNTSVNASAFRESISDPYFLGQVPQAPVEMKK